MYLHSDVMEDVPDYFFQDLPKILSADILLPDLDLPDYFNQDIMLPDLHLSERDIKETKTSVLPKRLSEAYFKRSLSFSYEESQLQSKMDRLIKLVEGRKKYVKGREKYIPFQFSFSNTTASASSMPAKASDPAVSDSLLNGGSGMQRLKRCLPMFLNGSRYNTTPDTGSLENAISADEVRRLGLRITGKGQQFLLGNSSRTISLGIVRLKCAFALGERCVTRQSFNVIDNLIVPVIIGKRFLDISKTMTLHQHRLETVGISAKKPFRVMHLNRPRQLVRCYVNGKLVYANPDTGSEVDLMSPLYACENMFKIETVEEGENWVQFANGSTAKLLGKTQVDLDIYDGRCRSPTGHIGHSRTFYLLDGLGNDVLLGEEALYNMHVFTEHEDSLVNSDDCGFTIEMNLITWFDKRTRQMSDTLAVLSSARSKQMTPSEVQELLNKLHARELHQREIAPQKLAALPAAERPAQERLEEARRHEYNTARDLLIQKRNAALLGSQQHAIRPPARTP